MRITLLVLITILFTQCKEVDSTWKKNKTEDGLPYRSFYPEEYGQGEKFPVILFLHGAGERGTDNEKQLVHIAPLLSSEEVQKKNPSILIFPQCPEEDYWASVNRDNGIWTVQSSENPTPAMAKVINLLEEILQDPHVDRSRIYLSGLSMGGFGTFDLLSRKPDVFAAAVPICGGADTSKVANYTHVPVWNFHGALDPVVPVELSQQFISKFIETGANPRYTEYHDGEHNVWNKAYAEKNLISWIFKQRT